MSRIASAVRRELCRWGRSSEWSLKPIASVVRNGTEKKRSVWLSSLASSKTLADEYIDSHGRKVGEVMTTRFNYCREEAERDEIIDLMEKHRSACAGRQGRAVVGSSERRNLVQALVDRSAAARRSARMTFLFATRPLGESNLRWAARSSSPLP